ncbi:MAG: polyprenyl synthetase family protein [Firmicutes bacterium]|nr:polyprenyl synthetase family protein [Bacillota bacterium]
MEEILKELEQDLREVESGLKAVLHPEDPVLGQVTEHFLSASGKRLRPALVLLAGKCSSYRPERLIKAAVALELVHMAALVHDDVVDGAERRRGIPSVNALWGNRVAVLLGDYFYARSLAIAAELGPEVVGHISRVINTLVDGELAQLKGSYNLQLTEEDYLERVRRKTADFISICCQLGGQVGDAPAEIQEALARYGYFVGMAFQIRDDLLDFIGDAGQLGKPASNDLAQGILTLPVIHALQNSVHKDELAWMLEKKRINRREMQTVKEWLEETGSLAYSQNLAAGYIAQAKESLNILPAGFARDGLSRIADFTANRAS